MPLDVGQKQEIRKLIERTLDEYLSNPSYLLSGLIRSRHIKSMTFDKLSTGTLTVSDKTATSKILVQDLDEVNRILLEGDGTLKISSSGNDVEEAATADLLMEVSGDNIFIRLGQFSHTLHAGPRQWTTNDTWTDVKSSIFELDGDTFKFTDVYFAALGCVEVEGRTASFRIYNTTDSVAVADSEISTTNVSSEGAGWMEAEYVLSSALTFASGMKEYKVQMKQNVEGGGGDSTQFFKAELFYAQGS